MLNVKLSTKACVFCGKNGSTVHAKSKDHDFQGVVCTEHMIALLKRWDRKEETNAPAVGSS